MNSMKNNAIAIIGTACRLPGNVSNIEEFWEFLKEGGDAVGEIPKERWSWQFHYDKNQDKSGKSYVNRGSFLSTDIEAFDAAFFDISPREAALLDPQQRLLLELTFEALEDAVGDVNKLQGSQTGVYVGCFMQDNLLTQMGPGAKSQVGTYTAVSSTMTMVSNRLSYVFDLKGPSFTLDTACSSSLVAVHQACLGLRSGDCNLAIAGGVSIMFRPEIMMMMSKGHFLAADGRSKTFSANADGYGRGEGAGLVVLKRLQDAIADGDNIQGIILSSGVNQDGNSEGITVPNEIAQIALASKVYQEGAIDPVDITYLEAHGTGTPVGDPIEMRAMGTSIGQTRSKGDKPLIVGSVKAGIGHLEAAAGITGLLKALLVAKHDHIPPQAWLDSELNPAIDFAGLNIQIADKYQRLPKSRNGRSYIAVNSFGYGGTNAHAVLCAPDLSIRQQAATEEPHAKPRFRLYISGASESACEGYARIYLDMFAKASPEEILNICRNAAQKTGLEFRWVISADSAEELVGKLQQTVNGSRVNGVNKGRNNDQQNPVFVFSGMGPQWWEMGQQLFDSEPVFAETLKQADKIFMEISGWSILAEMMRSEAESRMSETVIAQTANFMIQIGIVELLRSWGVTPAAVIGHSVGEVSSAYISGILSLRDALTVSYHRGRTQAKTAGTGSMLATGLGVAEAERVIAPYAGEVSIAGINSAKNTTLAGDEACIDAIASMLEIQGVFARKLRVEVPYHSAGMDPILNELRDCLKDLSPNAPKLPVYSTVTGKEGTDVGLFDNNYWCDNVRHPVYFKDAIESICDDGYETFLEIGPHPVLTGYIKEIMLSQGSKGICINTLKRKENENTQLSEVLAALWSNGVDIDFQSYLGAPKHKIKLPAYPWQRKNHWHEDKYARIVRQGWPDSPILLGYRTADPIATWHSELSNSVIPWLVDHKVGQRTVFPGAGYLEIFLAVLEEHNKTASEYVLRNIRFHRALVLADGECTVTKTIADHAGKLSIYAGISTRSDEWSLHGSAELITGKFSVPFITPTLSMDFADFTEIDVKVLYQRLQKLGLDYGKTFQSIKRLQMRKTLALIDLSVEDSCEHYIHPALLDGAFQSMLALNESELAYLPVGIKQIRFYERIGKKCQALLEITEHTERRINANVTLMVDGKVCCEVIDIRCDAIQLVSNSIPSAIDTATYRTTWFEIDSAERNEYLPHVAVVSEIVPDELKRGLTIFGCEKIDCFANLDALLKMPDFWSYNLITLCIDTPTVERSVDDSVEMLLALQQISRNGYNGKIIFVTQQAMALEIRHEQNGWLSSWATGLRRNSENELSAINFRHIDVDNLATDAYLLAAELVSAEAPDEVALIGRKRYAMQIKRLDSNNYAELSTHLMERFEDSGKNNFKLSTAARPSLQNLVFSKDERRAPANDQIEMRVDTVSLNYKDLEKLLGTIHDDQADNLHYGAALGRECSGVIVAVGENVTDYKVGDAVAATRADCLSRYLLLNTNPEDLPTTVIKPIPRAFTSGEASTLFVAYATALWGLRDIARLEAGETVLIHGAASGVGLAAVNLAKHLGACVIASAGTQEKRDYLLSHGADYVVNSRTLNFGSEVIELTHGKGVNVVFNSISGGIVPISFDVLAEFGRFIEIGKYDIFKSGALNSAPFNKNIQFSVLDLEFLAAKNPKKFSALIDDLWIMADQGYLLPLPITIYGADKLAEGFASIQNSEHIGKVVIDLKQTPLVSAIYPREHRLNPDNTVLITGGLGGVGLMYANWCADQGVKRLALLGRKGANTEETKALVAELEAKGVSVDVYACNVSDYADLSGVIADTERKGTLGGIIHAAGVLDDRSFLDMDSEAIKKVAIPKMVGANNLHLLTKDNPNIELFVVISSVSGVTGNTYQANYCLANTFMDGLIEYRLSKGLAGNSLQLGPVGQVGMMSSNTDLERYLKMKGLEPFDNQMMQAIFNRIYQWNLPALFMVDVDWPVWEYAEPGAAGSFRFKEMISKYGSGSDDSSIISVLAQMPKDQQIETVGYIVAEHIAGILHMNAEDVDLETSFDNFGIDSITAVELQTMINRSFQIEMSVLSLLSSKSIFSVASDIVGLIFQEQSAVENEGQAAEPTHQNINTTDKEVAI